MSISFSASLLAAVSSEAYAQTMCSFFMISPKLPTRLLGRKGSRVIMSQVPVSAERAAIDLQLQLILRHVPVPARFRVGQHAPATLSFLGRVKAALAVSLTALNAHFQTRGYCPQLPATAENAGIAAAFGIAPPSSAGNTSSIIPPACARGTTSVPSSARRTIERSPSTISTRAKPVRASRERTPTRPGPTRDMREPFAGDISQSRCRD